MRVYTAGSYYVNILEGQKPVPAHWSAYHSFSSDGLLWHLHSVYISVNTG